MSKITLYTPNTGLPDLELKIAYGLCRVAFEAGLEFEMRPRQGWWEVGEFKTLDGNTKMDVIQDKLIKAFRGVLIRILTADQSFQLPPLFTKGSRQAGQMRIEKFQYNPGKSPTAEEIFETFTALPSPEDTLALSMVFEKTDKKEKRPLCDHNFALFGGRSGLLQGPTHFVGKIEKRDSFGEGRSNLNLCEVCGWFSMLGYGSTALRFRLGNNPLVLVPVPKRFITRSDFLSLLLCQRELEMSDSQQNLPDKIDIRSLPLAIFAKVPHLSSLFLKDSSFDAVIYTIDEGKRKATSDVFSTRLDGYADFIRGQSDSYEPHNIALIRRMTQNINDTKGIFPLLSKALNLENINEKRRFASLFARELSANMNKDSERVFLLPRKTAKYLLEEVMMIKPELYRDDAIRAVAALLRHFVEGRNFGFVDRLRSAKKESHEFEEVIETMLRQARVASEKADFIPGPEKVTRVMEMAKEDFDGVRHALLILGLSRGFVKQDEPTKEVSS